MVKTFWTDEELLTVIQSGAPLEKKCFAWDQLIDKYQAELEEHALELWKGDDFRISDTVTRTWDGAVDNIHKVQGDLRRWLHATLRDQFMKDARKDHLGYGYIPLPLGPLEDFEGDDWMDWELDSESSSRQAALYETEESETGHQEFIRRLSFKSESVF